MNTQYTSALSVRLRRAEITCYSATNPFLSSERAKRYRIGAVTRHGDDICSLKFSNTKMKHGKNMIVVRIWFQIF